MSIFYYPRTVDYIPNLPHLPYRNGVGNYEGVVIHDTDSQGDSAINEHLYESRTWSDAFVHEFIDANDIIIQADKDYGCWGCGPHGNAMYYQIEMCMAKTQDEFNLIFDKTCARAAEMLYDKGLDPVDNVTIRSHRQISEEFPNDTNHQDPDAYLTQWGKTWADVVAKVQEYYQKLGEPDPSPAPEDDWKVKTIALAKERGFFKSDHLPGEQVTVEVLAGAMNNLYEKLGGK